MAVAIIDKWLLTSLICFLAVFCKEGLTVEVLVAFKEGLTMEVLVVSKEVSWLSDKSVAHACIVTESRNMLEVGCIPREWLEKLCEETRHAGGIGKGEARDRQGIGKG
jgi:hypothetical protein